VAAQSEGVAMAKVRNKKINPETIIELGSKALILDIIYPPKAEKKYWLQNKKPLRKFGEGLNPRFLFL
jgi:hypothetical protein